MKSADYSARQTKIREKEREKQTFGGNSALSEPVFLICSRGPRARRPKKGGGGPAETKYKKSKKANFCIKFVGSRALRGEDFGKILKKTPGWENQGLQSLKTDTKKEKILFFVSKSPVFLPGAYLPQGGHLSQGPG